MATSTLVESLLGALDSDVRKAFKQVFDYVLKNLRLGRPGHQAPSENLQASFVEGRTALVANEEFSILHGRESAPYLAIPVLDVGTVGSSVVPLVVTRAADVSRIYLSSSETDAPFSLLVEGP